MVNYLNGKIYRLVCNDTGKQYIGSTTTKLATRLCQHKKLFKDGRSGTSKQILENNNYKIVLLEDYPCDRKEQLLMRERFFIESFECVNKKIPLQTHHEWYMNHRDEYIARQMVWNNANKEKLKEYQKTFLEKKKGICIDLTQDISIDDEHIRLEIEDIYDSSEIMTEDIYAYIDSQINNKYNI